MNIFLCLSICAIYIDLVVARRIPVKDYSDRDLYIYYPSWNRFSLNELIKSTTKKPQKIPDFVPFENEFRSRLLPPPPPPSSSEPTALESEIEYGEMNPKDCGKTRDLITGGRVVGGRTAIREEFPWQVGLMSKQNAKIPGTYEHVCGATILNNRWIVTAAHCTHGVELSKLKGIIGTNDIRSLGEHGKQVYFDHVVIHNGYTHGEYNNDISLLHTTKEMPLFKNNTAMNAVCVKEQNVSHDGYVTVSGWGKITEEGPRTSRLRALDVPFQEGEACKKAYESLWHENNMLCAGFIQGGRDSCQADSGGPLVLNENDKSYLVGIVSFGNGCARRRNPGVYTKVSRYVQWIKDNMMLLEETQPESRRFGGFFFPQNHNYGYINRYNPYEATGFNPYFNGYNPYGQQSYYRPHGYNNRYRHRFNRYRNRYNTRYHNGHNNRYNGGRGVRKPITTSEEPFDELNTAESFNKNAVSFSPANCGKATAIGGRIVGGRVAQEKELPWQVSIQVNHLPSSRGEYTQYCGASIINERWIVTAAHCLTGVPLNAFKGVVGTNDITKLGRSGQELFFDKAIAHENYDENNSQHKYNNDIALLRTTTKIKITSDGAVNAICLPNAEERTDGLVTVSGWGRTSEGGNKSDKLRTVDVPVVGDNHCQNAYKTLFSTEHMICAGVLKGGKDSCQADSGGPLIKRKQDDKTYLVGIVSFGIGCARKGNPGVYTKVAHYTNWIQETIRRNS